MGIFLSRQRQNHNPNVQNLGSATQARNEIAELHSAAFKGDWNAALELFNVTPELIRAPITEGREIALHVAAAHGHQTFVSNLLDMMTIADVATQNVKGCTALYFAATAGHTQIVESMLAKDRNLANIKGDEGVWPLYMAALQGFGDMAEVLRKKTYLRSWTPLETADLLTSLINSELYESAREIVHGDRALIMAEDGNGETPLQVLARKPLAFSRDNGQGPVNKIIRSVLAYMESSNTVKGDAYKLMDGLWRAVEVITTDLEAAVDLSQLLFIAAKAGNVEFLVKLLRKNHSLLYKLNEDGHSIFHVAVLHRRADVFALMYELGGSKDMIAAHVDRDGNNMLHLAGKMSTLNWAGGSLYVAPLRMQWEVGWFMAVEKLVRPTFRCMKNKDGQTPWELFLAEHRDLRIEGEKYIKQAVKSCMVVAILVATLAITTAFTVPGGYNNEGVPVLLNQSTFKVFSCYETVAMLSSVTSVITFLLIHTSRYSNWDFLIALPLLMVVGLFMLLFSIGAMMVVFFSSLLSFDLQKLKWIGTLILPGICMMWRFPLMVTILRNTRSCYVTFRSHNRLPF